MQEYDNAEAFRYLLNVKKLPFLIYEQGFDDEFSMQDRI